MESLHSSCMLLQRKRKRRLSMCGTSTTVRHDCSCGAPFDRPLATSRRHRSIDATTTTTMRRRRCRHCSYKALPLVSLIMFLAVGYSRNAIFATAYRLGTTTTMRRPCCLLTTHERLLVGRRRHHHVWGFPDTQGMPKRRIRNAFTFLHHATALDDHYDGDDDSTVTQTATTTISSDETATATTTVTATRTPRSERKALERQKKMQQLSGNNKKRKSIVSRAAASQRMLEHTSPSDIENNSVGLLHDVSSGKSTTAATTLLQAIKRAQYSHNVADLQAVRQSLLTTARNHGDASDDDNNDEERTTTATMAPADMANVWARLAVAAVSLSQFDLADEAWHQRHAQLRLVATTIGQQDYPHEDLLPMAASPHETTAAAAAAAALLRAYLRANNSSMAWHILDTELPLVVGGDEDDHDDDKTVSSFMAKRGEGNDDDKVGNDGSYKVTDEHDNAWLEQQKQAQERIQRLESRERRLQYRALCLASMASRYFFGGQPHEAVATCRLLAETGSYYQSLCNNGSKSGSTFSTGSSTGSNGSSNSNLALGSPDSEYRMPWERLLLGAVQCQSRIRNNSLDINNFNSTSLDEMMSFLPLPLQKAGDAFTSTSTYLLPCNVVYAVLAAMSCFAPDNSDRLYELVATALVRRVVFVTGAVTMAGCPAPDRGEACFIGRSNVGKSSLINMITSRKALAYTSKRPGKTQQFNFFAVNDVPGKEKEIKYGDVVPGQRDADSFYIVDLPGFGYAKVPEHQRNTWLNFMHEYLAHRPSLRVVFHLIDSRHGPTEDDAIIMKQVAETIQKTSSSNSNADKSNSPSPIRSVSYVVVLTKSDKNVKGGGTSDDKKRQGRTGQVSNAVLTAVRDTMRTCGVAHAPVILSSAETKLGRDDLWRYLRLAAER